MRNIESITIVRIARGYLAHLRFTDPALDEDICAESRWGIMQRIDKVMYAKDRLNYFGKV